MDSLEFLDFMKIKLNKNFNYSLKFNSNTTHEFIPDENKIIIGDIKNISPKDLEIIKNLLHKNNIKPTNYNLDLFCYLHEIGHYNDYINNYNENTDLFLSKSFNSDNKSEYRNNVLEQYADNYALANFNTYKNIIK